MAEGRKKKAVAAEAFSAGGNSAGFYSTHTDAPDATGAFPPNSGLSPSSWFDAAPNAIPPLMPMDKSSDRAAIPDMSSPYANLQSWGNGTHHPGGFMSYFQNQSNMSQNFHFVGAPSHFTQLNANGSSVLLANGSSVPLAETPSPPPRAATRNQEPVNVDSDNDNENGVFRTNLRLNWIQPEDVRPMSAWLNNSMDPINGNDKKAEKYWGDVAREYNHTTPRDR